MKIKSPCDNCLVDPMCKEGCAMLWNHREDLTSLINQTSNRGRLFLTLSACESVLYGILWFFEFPVKPYHHWIAYSIFIFPALFYLFIRLPRFRKKMIKVESGPRSQYIWGRAFHDASIKTVIRKRRKPAK